jgi:hypothetical protein
VVRVKASLKPSGPVFWAVGIEGFTEPGPFDHVVAVLSLHHVEDLSGGVEKRAYTTPASYARS